MRKSLAFLFAIVVLNSCNSKSDDTKAGVVIRDTTKTYGLYIDFEKKDVFLGPIWVITRDTFVFKLVDSSTIKKVWGKDSMVFTPRYIKDSTGKEGLFGVPAAFETVSFEREFDSAVVILKRWIASHPQYFKPDSTAKPK